MAKIDMASTPWRAVDSNGDPAPSAKLYVYANNTTTPVTTFSDEAMLIKNAHPIVSNGYGVFAPFYVPDGATYTVDLTDANGASLVGFPLNDVSLIPSSSTDIANATTAAVTAQAKAELAQANAASLAAAAGAQFYTSAAAMEIATDNGDWGYIIEAGGVRIYENVSDVAIARGWLEKPAFTTFAAFVASGLTWSAGETLEVKGIDATYTATDSTGNLGQTNAGGQAWLVSCPSGDVRAWGAVGDGVTDDTAAINAALAVGRVHFTKPEAHYLVSDELNMPDGCVVTGLKWAAKIQQTVAGKNGFVTGHNCSIENVYVEMPSGNNDDLAKQNAVYINGKRNVTVRGNILELSGTAVSGVQVRGASTELTIKENLIFGGLWSVDSGPAASASDILLYSSSESARITIEGNHCLSNTSQGIFADALGYNAEVIISNNICVTLDPTTCTLGGAWSEVANGGVRRHGIVMGYNTSAVSGPRSIISGNLCRNTRWTGIYLQGVSAGRICANNVCSNNGYEIGNSLSGGIYILQSGNETVHGNTVIGFQNTLASTGGITVNATATPSLPSKVTGNFIRDSLGSGIALGTNTALCHVTDNLITGSAGTDIYAVPSNAVGNGGYLIARNHIVRASGTSITSISVSAASLSSLITRIHNNHLVGFDNATSNTTNVGIRANTAGLGFYDIKANHVENYYHGIYSSTYQTTDRDAVIESNVLSACSYGVSIGATSANVTIPLVNNRFFGSLVGDVGAALGGGVAGRICDREGSRLVAHTYSAAPTSGTWEVGDRAVFAAPVAGGSIGAVCVTAGSSGSWKTYGSIAA